MARTKQTKRRSQATNLPKLAREPSKWGTAAAGVTHKPPTLPSRTDDTSGNPSYKGISSMYSLIQIINMSEVSET